MSRDYVAALTAGVQKWFLEPLDPRRIPKISVIEAESSTWRHVSTNSVAKVYFLRPLKSCYRDTILPGDSYPHNRAIAPLTFCVRGRILFGPMIFSLDGKVARSSLDHYPWVIITTGDPTRRSGPGVPAGGPGS